MAKYMYPDTDSGIWYFRKRVNGKLIRFSLETKSEKVAALKRNQHLKEFHFTGGVSSRAPKFSKLAEEWKKLIRKEVRNRTYEEYEKCLNTYLMPEFGDMPVDTIKRKDIKAFLAGLDVTGKYKRNIMTPFNGVMEIALDEEHIQHNPAFGIKKKGKRSKKAKPFSKDQIDTFLNGYDGWYHEYFQFLFGTGVRLGEACGLQWSDVNLDQGTAQIKQTYVSGELLDPKTEESHRDIKLSDMAVEALIKQRTKTYGKSKFVFTNTKFEPINTGRVNKNIVKPLVKRLDLPAEFCLKNTRNTYITTAIDNGEKIGGVVKQVGHTDIGMVIKHYYGQTENTEYGEKLNEALSSRPVAEEPIELENNAIKLRG